MTLVFSVYFLGHWFSVPHFFPTLISSTSTWLALISSTLRFSGTAFQYMQRNHYPGYQVLGGFIHWYYGIVVTNTYMKYYWLLATAYRWGWLPLWCHWLCMGTWVIVDNIGGGGGGCVTSCHAVTAVIVGVVSSTLTYCAGGRHPGCSLCACSCGTMWQFQLLV